MDNKISKKTILILIFMIIGVIIAGTFAWLSFRSKDTAMVLTVGQIDNVRITLSPYQIKSNMGSVLEYSSGTVTNIEAINNSSSSKKFKLYYKINTIDSNLAISSFKYTITRSSTKNGTYTTYGTEGNFNGATSNSEKVILEETLASNETYYYKVYIWLDGNGNVSSASGKVFNAELRADILGHTVTFDANGGTVNISSKEVTTGLQYGELPTPTRKGYKFLGWNGKNKLNLSSYSYSKCIRNNDNSITSNIDNSYYASIWATNLIDYFKNNSGKTFTFSMNESIDNMRMAVVVYGSRTNGATYQDINSTIGSREVSITIADDFTTITRVELRFNRASSPITDTTTTRTSFQLEEGNEATAYEPYYITSDTIVVQDQDHTLTAIWEETNPVVTLNADGGTIPATTGWTVNGSTATKQVGYNDVYGNLPMPTRSGYTFLGWHGKNLFNLDDFVDFYAPYQSTPAQKIIFDGYEVWKIYGAVNETGRSLHYMEGKFKTNTQYTISLDTYEVWTQSGTSLFPGMVIYVKYTDETKYTLTGRVHDYWNNIIFTSPANKTISHLSVSYGTGGSYSYFKNFKLEEGTTATQYEPYYISSNTTVVQENNHTLTAMWKAN